jgi:SAM-dependent methyltransferase
VNTNIKKGSPDRFGYEWTIYNKILPIYEEQFKRWTSLIAEEEWTDRSFLDVGCGTGRNSIWPVKYGAKNGVAIDVDDGSLGSAKENLKDLKNVDVKKISAYDIPYENEFDIVFSIGVIHHLEFPEKALVGMKKATKEGGKVLIWVYGYENSEWVVKYLNPLRKFLFSKMPIKVTHFLSIFPTAVIYSLVRMGLGKIEYFKLIRQFSFWHLRSIVFDQMLPCIANYWKRDEVINLMEKVGLKDVKIAHVNDMSWCAVGIK